MTPFEADLWVLDPGLRPTMNFLGSHIYEGIWRSGTFGIGPDSRKSRLPPFLASPIFPGQTLIENLRKNDEVSKNVSA